MKTVRYFLVTTIISFLASTQTAAMKRNQPDNGFVKQQGNNKQCCLVPNNQYGERLVTLICNDREIANVPVSIMRQSGWFCTMLVNDPTLTWVRLPDISSEIMNIILFYMKILQTNFPYGDANTSPHTTRSALFQANPNLARKLASNEAILIALKNAINFLQAPILLFTEGRKD